jgi:hypothetical protein
MPDSARRNLYLVVAFVLTANCLDLVSTYAVSPDLANEWNILERHFGLGWPGIVCAKLLGCWLAILGYAFYLRNRAACYPPPGADCDSFCRYLTFGRMISWVGGWSGFSSGKHLGVNLGYFWAGMQGLVVWVALDNWLLRYGLYSPMRRHTEIGYHLLQSAVIASMVMLRFYLGNYRRYCLLAQRAPSGAQPESQGTI